MDRKQKKEMRRLYQMVTDYIKREFGKTYMEQADELGISYDQLKNVRQDRRTPSRLEIDAFLDHWNVTEDMVRTGAPLEAQAEYTRRLEEELEDVKRKFHELQEKYIAALEAQRNQAAETSN